ncbi:MAG TPA: metal-dependent transcriptional regulator [Oligoflexia bacterium]|nr:metal-dependent transcriptional regulator [Oligoflexia bacterium]HMP48292.1 metal-dependent transcriptional regulator [Oligoflexia bacterium]
MSESTTEVWKEFGENEITHSAAHHLLAIYELHEKRGYARVTDVAKFLEITTGSASTNLKSLKAKGLIDEDDNKFLSLSAEGRRLTEAILSRRTILEEFFTKVLGVSEEQASIDACKTEHLLSDETTKKMSKMSANWAR